MPTAKMRWIGWCVMGTLPLLNVPCVRGATPTQTVENVPPAPVVMTAEQDHQKMMEKLKITSLRRGADGDPKSANAANADESKATPYPNLPDPLILKNGKKVTNSKTWWEQRRPEIVEDFDREIYGRVPAVTPKVKWEVTSTTQEMNGDIPVTVKKLVGHVDNSAYPQITVDIQLTVTTPTNATGPVPMMIEFGFGGFPGRRAGAAPPPPSSGPVTPSWQQQLLAKGWGYAVLIPTSVQADNGAGLTQGIIGLCNKGQSRKVDDWGALRAWAWGASRALDYLETDKAVNAKQVGIEGLSRYGKAAAVAMAYEPRFAIAFIGSSGEGGVKIHRRDFGEKVENVASSGEYHWMAGNFIKYAGPLTPNDLPVDAHELVALCAPRPVFVGSGSPQVEGTWVDAKGMFLGAVGAGPVYKLLGKKDLGTTEMPPIDQPLIDGDVAFRQHNGGHTNGPNWATFLTFASRYIKAKPLAPGVKLVSATPTANQQTSTASMPQENSTPLKNAFKDIFPIGTILSIDALQNKAPGKVSIAQKHFSAFTAENSMKPDFVQPREGEFTFADGDKLVELAQQSSAMVVGHTLIWHGQTPRWFFEGTDGQPINRELALARMRKHIETVVGHYKGKIKQWDVVNEAISDSGDKDLRPSPWLKAIGEDYIEQAFRAAHKADPDAILIYNDYNIELGYKRPRALRVLKSLIAKGVPIHAVGIQCHWRLDNPNFTEVEESIKLYSELGLKVMITELDIGVLPTKYQGADISSREAMTPEQEKTMNPYTESLPDSVAKEHAERYRQAFEMFLRHRKNIGRVTIWGVEDSDSWLNNFPVRGRTDYAVLFDRAGKPKPAFFAVEQAAKQKK